MRFWLYILVIGTVLMFDVSGVGYVYGLPTPLNFWLEAGCVLLLVLAACGWIGLAAMEQDTLPVLCAPAGVKDGGAINTRLLIGLLLLAWAATANDVLSFLVPEHDRLLVGFFAAGGLLWLAALVRPPRSVGWLVLMAVVLGSSTRLLTGMSIPMDGSPGDILGPIQQALQHVVSGGALNRTPWQTALDLLLGVRLPDRSIPVPWQVALTSLPVTWLVYLPFSLAGVDIRLANLLAEWSVGGVLVWVAVAARAGLKPAPTLAVLSQVWRGERVLLLWAWVFLLPSSLHWWLKTMAPVSMALIGLLLVLLVLPRKHQWVTAVAAGLSTAASLLCVFLAPLVLLRWLRLYGWWSLARFILVSGLAGFLCLLPFVLWLPMHFGMGVWTWFDGNSIYPHLFWQQPGAWVQMVGFSRFFWAQNLTLWLVLLQTIVLMSISILAWCWGARERTLLPLATAALVLVGLLHPSLGAYTYNPVLVVILLTAARLTGQPEPASESGALAGQRTHTGSRVWYGRGRPGWHSSVWGW